jgi:hypothetical protein
MAPLIKALDMYEEMVRRGLFVPAAEQEVLAMPTLLRTVPTITTYNTQAVPVNMGAHADARLEGRSSADRA